MAMGDTFDCLGFTCTLLPKRYLFGEDANRRASDFRAEHEIALTGAHTDRPVSHFDKSAQPGAFW